MYSTVTRGAVMSFQADHGLPMDGVAPEAPTALGTYPVYLRFTSTTMRGTEPDGARYYDPGVPG